MELLKKIEDEAIRQYQPSLNNPDGIKNTDLIRKIFIKGASFALSLSEQQKSNWIDVNVQLPERDKPILCTDGRHIHYCTFRNAGFYRHVDYIEGDRIMMPFYQGITHWRELPTPPIPSQQKEGI
jgi:hypothetical protein